MRLIDVDNISFKEINKALKDLSWWCDTNEQDGVVYIPSSNLIKDIGQIKDYLEYIKQQPTEFDIDDILRQCKDKAIQLMNKQYNEDEYHMFSKGVQAMYLGLEKIIKENKIYSEIDVDMCINCTKSKYSNQGRPYCAKEERHLDSFNYKPDWCPLKAGGLDD